MILECVDYVKSVLTEIGISTIYDKASDVAKFKSGCYALIQTKEDEKAEYDGCKIAYTDDYEKSIRTYHIRRYKVENSLRVQIVDKVENVVLQLKKEFLKKIGTSFVDTENYRIEVTVNNPKLMKDEAILASGAGYEFNLVFSGGIYVTREVKLITSVDTETEIIQTQKEAAEHGADTENRS